MAAASRSTRPVSPKLDRGGGDVARRPAPSVNLPLAHPPSAVSLQPSLVDSPRAMMAAARRLTPGESARTPSYPFPQMPSHHRRHESREPPPSPARSHPTAAAAAASSKHTREDRHDTPALSRPSMAPDPTSTTARDHASGMVAEEAASEFPAPSLYEAILMLHSEPGLEQWWARVVQLSRQYYKAARLSLVVPADPTDIYNVPWGLKATFDAAEGDPKSVTYLQQETPGPAREASAREASARSSGGAGDPAAGQVEPPSRPPLGESRPKLESRHSFAGFEGRKQAAGGAAAGPPQRSRLSGPMRTRSYLSMTPPPEDAGRQEKPVVSSDALRNPLAHSPPRELQLPPAPVTGKRARSGRIVPVLQALDYEAEPLIDAAGVSKVLERGEIVVLSREYTASPEASIWNGAEEGPTSFPGRQRPPPSRTSSREPPGQDEPESPTAPRRELNRTRAPLPGPPRETTTPGQHGPGSLSVEYEDFEQAPSSPWSQSPGASPAIRPDPPENPFFVGANVDEASFNPTSPAVQDYSSSQLIQAIGVDKSSSVIHVPLVHPLLSHPNAGPCVPYPAPSDDIAAGFPDIHRSPDSPNVPELLGHIGASAKEPRRTAIAILSISSSLVPYPRHLVPSLSALAPHLATSYSLAQHFTDMQSQATNLLSRYWRPPNHLDAAAAGPESRPLEDLAGYGMAYSTSSTRSAVPSANGSVASPSERSLGSPGESLVGTPSWDPANIGFSSERRASGGASGHAPGTDMVDSYFLARQRQPLTRTDSGASVSAADFAHGQARLSTQTSSTLEGRWGAGPGRMLPPLRTQRSQGDAPSHTSAGSAAMEGTNAARNASESDSGSSVSPEQQGLMPPPEPGETGNSSTKHSPVTPRVRRSGGHSLLHSYGADFGATFQSLPTAAAASAASQRGPLTGRHSRSASESASGPGPVTFEMPPPSERLLRTMIDAIPVQIFTAAPQTGNITWVNSKFLAYRGHTVQDFMKDPWQSIHPDQRDDYLRMWSHSLRNGEQFSYRVRLLRFDGNYRWFYVRAAPLKDKKGITVHWFGSNMDIHDQHIAELSAARQAETAASESKYRALANSSPQIVFAATDSKGVVFANTQWRHYSGQQFNDALGLGFTEHIHPEDLAKCKLPGFRLNVASSQPKEPPSSRSRLRPSRTSSSSSGWSTSTTDTVVEQRPAQRSKSAGAESRLDRAEHGLDATMNQDSSYVKVMTDNDGRPCYSAEMRLKSKDGEYRWHLVRCVMVDSPVGEGEPSWFGTCTDINDHKLFEQKMKETMESKTRFLSNMSHEIRTPLIGISGMVEFLYHTQLTSEQLDYCDTIWSSSSGLLNIVNDILDLSKIEAGMMSLSHDWFHIRSTIESVNDALSSQAINKGLELNYIVEEDVPPVVRGDQARIRQVLMNILGNAVKFTARGEVFAHCQLIREPDEPLADDEIVLEFEVIDTGAGFTKKDAELIFKPFSQIDASSTRQYGGSGLGLVISRQLVELHGGRMTGSSIPGKGSTFRFRARFAIPKPDTPIPSEASDASQLETPPSLVQPASPYLSKGFTQSPANAPTPGGDSRQSPALVSSAGSDPSIRSIRTHQTDRSSMSSILPPVAPASTGDMDHGDAARMKLVMPRDGSGSTTPCSPPATTPERAKAAKRLPTDAVGYPRLYSILVVSLQPYSLRAVTKHIEMCLPRVIPHQVTACQSLVECQRMLGGDSPVIFTHIVLNVSSADQVIALMDQLFQSAAHLQTNLVILADARTRQEVKRQAREREYDSSDHDARVQFLHKPIKPSRLAEIFDPRRERNSSTDRIRRSAEQQTDRRKQVFVEMERNVGNKGHRVLVVEDNPTNQKVMGMFLQKVGVQFEMVTDGVECTQLIFSKDHGTYSLVLCDLQMPNKDGYQTCKEIRQWERRHHYPSMPIIALSANVIGDVIDRCLDAGFNSYLSKPVEFKSLCKAMTELMDPSGPRDLPPSAGVSPGP